MKILIVRFSSIGDIVLTTPVIRCVKQQVADADIHYLTKPAYRAVLANNPYIDTIHELDKDWTKTVESLQKENFDCIIDLHHNLRTLRLKKALDKITNYSFSKLNFQKWLLTALKINRLPKVHIVDRYLAAAAPLGVVNDGKGLDYFLTEKDEVLPDRLPLSHCAGYVAVVIGATYNTKKLPVHKLKELCASIDYPIMLLGGKEDQKTGDEIASVDDIKIFNACGLFKLNESADLVRKSRAVISHDTGLMHMAAAFQKPIISVWGNTVPAFGMTPYYGKANENSQNPNGYFPLSFIAEVTKLYCRPCSKIGYKKCPLGHFKCMEKQDLPAIRRSVVKILSQPASF